MSWSSGDFRYTGMRSMIGWWLGVGIWWGLWESGIFSTKCGSLLGLIPLVVVVMRWEGSEEGEWKLHQKPGAL